MSPPPAARYYRLYTLALAGVLAVVLPGCGSGGGAAATPGGGGKKNDAGTTGHKNPQVAPQKHSLRFRTQPDTGLAGLPFSQMIEVEVVDKKGAVVNATIPIGIRVHDSTGNARLGGSLLVSAQGGVATFSNLLVTAAGRDLTLVASADVANPAVSKRFTRDVSAGKRHVILLIADGWGYKQIEAVRTFTGALAPYEDLDMLPMSTWDTDVQMVNGPMPYDPQEAWSDMSYLVRAVTDSASAATALFTGQKTNSGRIAVGPHASGRRLVSVSELALRNGLGSGAVTSVPISHATPAAWAAHNDTRGSYLSIGDEMLFGDPAATGSGWGGRGTIDVLPHVVIGGGHPDFGFGLYVSPFQLEKAKKESGNPGGWQIAEKVSGRSAAETLLGVSGKQTTRRIFGLFGSGGGNIPFRLHDGSGLDPEDPTLAEMTRGALQVLARQPKGFCLMVEGGAVDWAAHNNNMSQLIGEMIGFDEMVEEVIRWIEAPNNGSSWSNTLLVVTGDHETGLLTAGPGLFPDLPLAEVTEGRILMEQYDFATNTVASWDDLNADGMIDPEEPVHWAWNTGHHSNSLIPCYFRGIESHRFAGLIDGVDPRRGKYIDNVDVFEVMLGVLRR
ncbi:MAG: alkaline phosphatase [Planctomycetota bacterium]|nr:alkaline phosphatase [Planctomycetota bacterium]